MTRVNGALLFESMFPGFFEREMIRNLPEGEVEEDLILRLDEFESDRYSKKLEDGVSFGYFEGDMEDLKKEVAKVVPFWTRLYNGKYRPYCGYINGKIASFCLVEGFGEHIIDGCRRKVGGPGCVGTVPEYRNKGIGLTMVKKVTQILKEEGYDYSYIHFTGVAPWYKKLGYETSVRWTKDGLIR